MVFEHSPDAIFIEDLEGNVLDANPAACRLHRLTHEQLVGKNVSELVPADLRDSVVRQIGRLVDGEVEGVSLASDGKRIPVSIRSSAIEFMVQKAVLLHVRDISERRRSEDPLRDSEERYRLLFDCNPQPMWVHDLESRRFLAVNDAAVRLYKYSSDEFLVMDSTDRLWDQPDPVAAELPQLKNIVNVAIARHGRKDGTILNVELTQHTMKLDGRFAAFVMISKVISSSR